MVSNLLSCGVIILGKLYIAYLQITGLVINHTNSTMKNDELYTIKYHYNNIPRILRRPMRKWFMDHRSEVVKVVKVVKIFNESIVRANSFFFLFCFIKEVNVWLHTTDMKLDALEHIDRHMPRIPEADIDTDSVAVTLFNRQNKED